MTQTKHDVEDRAAVAGEDELPRMPAQPLDPSTPEPSLGPGTARGFRVLLWAWMPALAVIGLVIWVAAR